MAANPDEILDRLAADGILTRLPGETPLDTVDGGVPLTAASPFAGLPTMCPNCTGLRRVLLPGRRDPVRCPSCNGAGVR